MLTSRLAPALLLPALLLGTPSSALADAGYDKGFKIASDDDGKSYSLTINGLLQAQFNLLATEDGVGKSNDTYAFELTRARIILKGHLGSKALTFKLFPDMGKGAGFMLREFYVNYAFSDAVQLRVGQWKRPLSRQFLASSSTLGFVDRALTEKAFGTGFDIGLALHNNYEASPELEWVVGLFNGPGDVPKASGTVAVPAGATSGTLGSFSTTNVPKQVYPVVVARVGYNVGAMKGEGYTELDLNPDKGFRLGVAASGLFDLGLDDEVGAIVGGFDFVLKHSGFTALGNVFARTITGDDGGFDAFGVQVDASYVIGGTVAPMVRFARVMPDDDTKATTQELALGAAVLFSGHSLKWVTDVAAMGSEVGGDSTTDWRVRTQLQTAF